MEIEFNCSYSISLSDSKINTIIKAFMQILPQILNEFVQKVLLLFAEEYMGAEEKPFKCEKEGCGNKREFKWKTRHGEETSILTIFQKITLNQLQVECKKCGHKFYITRKLLGLKTRQRICKEARRKMGLIGALTSFRVAEKIVGMFGWALSKMTIWRGVQETSKEIEFCLDLEEEAKGESDGKGIPIQGIEKRGKEMKVFIQLKKKGGVRVAGLSIGDYNKGWDKLFGPLVETMKKFQKKFLLVTDGDTSIFKGIKGKVEIILQRCLWHIPHQLKYTLWQDKVKIKTEKWLGVMARIFEICAIRQYVDDIDIIETMVQAKEKQLDDLIAYCRANQFNRSAEYLSNAKPNMFTAIRNRLEGKTTSRVERVMRTINLRINMGKWSTKGALNLTKIRLAYYYNGFDA